MPAWHGELRDSGGESSEGRYWWERGQAADKNSTAVRYERGQRTPIIQSAATPHYPPTNVAPRGRYRNGGSCFQR